MKVLKVGPNAITALSAFDLSTVFNTTNCSIIYSADGSYKSWVPGRDLNAFEQTEASVGYIAIMKTTLDVSEHFFSVEKA